MIDDSLQSADKDQQESRAVAGKPHTRMYETHLLRVAVNIHHKAFVPQVDVICQQYHQTLNICT